MVFKRHDELIECTAFETMCNILGGFKTFPKSQCKHATQGLEHMIDI
jgi:hypothetical protein